MFNRNEKREPCGGGWICKERDLISVMVKNDSLWLIFPYNCCRVSDEGMKSVRRLARGSPKILTFAFISDRAPLQFLPLQHQEFNSLPAGFEYDHELSSASNTIAFDMEVDHDARDFRTCVVCRRETQGGLHPGVTRAHVIGKTENVLVRDCFLL